MSSTTALGIAATTFGIVMGIAPILQIRTMIERRSSSDVSIGFLSLLLVGFVLWLAYGIALGNAALIISNLVALTSYSITTIVVLRFRAAPALD